MQAIIAATSASADLLRIVPGDAALPAGVVLRAGAYVAPPDRDMKKNLPRCVVVSTQGMAMPLNRSGA
jgi:hypothetical protein